MVNNSTNIKKKQSPLTFTQRTQKRTRHIKMEIQVPTRDGHKKVARLKPSLAEYSVQQQMYMFFCLFFLYKTRSTILCKNGFCWTSCNRCLNSYYVVHMATLNYILNFLFFNYSIILIFQEKSLLTNSQ